MYSSESLFIEFKKLTVNMKSIIAILVIQSIPLLASVEDLLGPDLVNAKGQTIETSTLNKTLIGLFFSNGSNPNCKDFTPKLVAARDANRAFFEVVLISSDTSAEEQLKYMKSFKINFPATPFDPEKYRKIASKFGVDRVPTVVIIDSEGNHLTNQGRPGLAHNPRESIQDWRKASRKMENTQ